MLKPLRSAALRAMVWFAPSFALIWPRKDPIVIVALLIPLFGAMAIALVTDPVSYTRKDGGDAISERRIGVALLLAIVGAAIGWRHELLALDATIRLAACAILAAAYALRIVAMGINRFFAGVLVIQAERDHRVIDRGPYRIVRHPGNLSAILIALALPLAIGSWCGAPFSILAALVVLDRTRKEERFLFEHLAGYREYALRVRARLIPGVY